MEQLTRAFAHNAWANHEALRALQAATSAPGRAVDVMAHILGAECEWLRRLGQGAPDLRVWPALALTDCVRFLPALADAWSTLLGGPAGGLERTVHYTNSKGERWSNTVVDILTHVTLHSSYHRGQIATLLGRAGEPVAYTDYIEFVRRGYADGGRSG